MSLNRINVYTCPYGHQTITIDRADGITPLNFRCKKHGCQEFAASSWYMVDQRQKPEYEWYKPGSMVGLSEAEIEHVQKGGLLIRKIK